MTFVTNAVVVSSTYHHGNLREAVLRAAAEAVQREGPHAVNLRALAREIGVSHTAPRHHFGDGRGVLTALAVQGYRELTQRLREAADEGDFLDMGVAYVGFALERPAHFQVLFRPDLVNTEDPCLRRAADALSDQLTEGARHFTALDDDFAAGGSSNDGIASSTALAAWSMAHGFATLAISGTLSPSDGDLIDLARITLRHLGAA